MRTRWRSALVPSDPAPGVGPGAGGHEGGQSDTRGPEMPKQGDVHVAHRATSGEVGRRGRGPRYVEPCDEGGGRARRPRGRGAQQERVT